MDILKFKPGLNSFSRDVFDEVDAFKLFINRNMVNSIVKHSIEYAKSNNISISLSNKDIYQWIGIVLFFGLVHAKNMSLEELWNDRYGHECVQKSMSLHRFNQIKKIIRFDNKEFRSKFDKLAPIRIFFHNFTLNLQKYWTPGDRVTVDEQLVNFRGRCPFKVYIPSKPGKYGIKIWALCDSDSAYMINAQVYIGKENNAVEKNQGERVVKDLCANVLNSGRTIVTDNFFTTYSLAQYLKEKKTCIVGTIRKSRVFAPKVFSEVKNIDIGTSKYLYNKKTTILQYADKKNKPVMLLSTFHHCPATVNNKPEIVEFYNKNKAGVDRVDQVIKFYSCKRGSRRWPLTLFYNCLDIAAYNSYVLFCHKFPIFVETFKKKSRKEYLLNLSISLMKQSEQEFDEESQNKNTFEPASKNSKYTRCTKCERKKDKKTPFSCNECKTSVCKDHFTIVCHDCFEKFQ